MYKIQNCRYVGGKSKLISFIAKVLDMENIKFNIFSDLFAGTGIVSEYFLSQNETVYININDSLYSNYGFIMRGFLMADTIKPRYTIF
jgi:adenine-specific DNA-methyltransferase